MSSDTHPVGPTRPPLAADGVPSSERLAPARPPVPLHSTGGVDGLPPKTARGGTWLSSLPPASRRLVDAMSLIGYGRVSGLVVLAGQPVLGTGLRVSRERKLGSSPPKPEESTDYLLTAQVVDLLEQLQGLPDGSIAVIDVRGGLPFLLTTEEVLRD